MAYLKKILALGQTLERGKAYNVAIAHDEWCEIYEGGPCTCDAAVKVLDGPPALESGPRFQAQVQGTAQGRKVRGCSMNCLTITFVLNELPPKVG